MNIKKITLYLIFITSGLLVGYFLFSGSPQPISMEEHVDETHTQTNAQGETIYTCSMHPQVRENEPGNCPICGMKLIPVQKIESSEEKSATIFSMTDAAVKMAEIQTSPVLKKIPVIETVLSGKITIDERERESIPAHFSGRIEELYVNFTGEYISGGQKIARIYSPVLFTAQKELLEAYAHKDSYPELYRSTRQKLLNWKITEKQIDAIVASGKASEELDIHAHKNGYVLKKSVNVGDHLEMGSVMFEISELKNLWIIFEAYESALWALEKGDDIYFTVAAIPDKNYKTQINYIDPILDNSSRTVDIRSNISNPDAILKPGMFVKGVVKSKPSDSGKLMVPRSAVMWTGIRSVVYVKLGDADVPTFEAREVILGMRSGDFYVIESGVKEGEQVVSYGTFKIDAAAQLSDKFSMMNNLNNQSENK